MTELSDKTINKVMDVIDYAYQRKTRHLYTCFGHAKNKPDRYRLFKSIEKLEKIHKDVKNHIKRGLIELR